MYNESRSARPTKEGSPLFSVVDAVEGRLTEQNEATAQLLSPYTDPDFLEQRLMADSRLFRRLPELTSSITESLSSGNSEDILGTTDLLAYARAMFAPKGNPPATIIGALTTSHKIDKLAGELATKNPTERDVIVYRFSSLASLNLRDIASEIPPEELPSYFHSCLSLSEMMRLLPAGPNTRVVQMDIEWLSYFARMVWQRFSVYAYFSLMPSNETEEPTQAEVAADNTKISALFKEMNLTRQFGLKPGYTSDERGGSLVFSTTDDLSFVPGEHSDTFLDNHFHNSLAMIVHSKRKSFKNVRLRTRDAGLSDMVKTTVVDMAPLDPVASFYLGEDGELYNEATCTDRALDLALAAGKYTAYRDLQATILAHYYDLTHSVGDISNIKAQIDSSHNGILRTGTVPTELISKLLIPRARYRADEESDSNNKDDDDHLIEPQARELRLHSVVMHRRKLPEGWSPSPEALEIANQLGIRLLPGETIVREHKRGSELLGEIAAHKLINRNDTH